MSDPYRNHPSAPGYSNSNAHRAYSHGATGHPRPQQPQQQPQNYLRSRTPSFDNGDDAVYFDGGTGVSARQSVRGTEEPYDNPLPEPPNRRGSMGPVNGQGGGGYFAVTPGGNGNGGYQPQSYPSGTYPSQNTYDSGVPYPTTPGNNGNQTPVSAHQPYNPASYQAPRHGTMSAVDYPPQRHNSGYAGSGQFSPTTGTYNPSTFTSAPYPTYRPGQAQAPLHIPTGVPPPHPAQQPYVSGYPSYGSRPQYATQTQSMYISTQGGQYSPGLPPPPTQSAPPHSVYQPPPPPPPPHPPNSPGFTPGSYGQQSYTTPYPSHNSSGLSHSHSLSQSSSKTYTNRPETHYQSGSDSDISGPSDSCGHPLPSPPKGRPPPLDNSKYKFPPAGSNPLPSPPPPTPPSHASFGHQQGYGYGSLPPVPDRADSTRHPAARPLPQAPGGYSQELGTEGEAAEGLYADVEASLLGMGSSPTRPVIDSRGPSPLGQIEENIGGRPPYPRGNGSTSNGHLHSHSAIYDYYSNESDAEAAAGLEMMRMEEDQEQLDRMERDRRAHDEMPPPETKSELAELESDSDYAGAGMDLSMFGGGFPGGMGGFYGPGPGYQDDSIPVLPGKAEESDISRMDSSASASSRTARRQTETYTPLGVPDGSDQHPFPEFQQTARVDTWGTGGLAKPNSNPRRMSFDEGDESPLRSASESPMKRTDSEDDFPELFYMPPSISSPQSPLNARPLPSPPYNEYISELRPAGTTAPLPYPDSDSSSMHTRQTSVGAGRVPVRQYSTPLSADGLSCTMSSLGLAPQFPRSTSLSSHASGPQTVPPIRSKTDGKAHPSRPVANRNSVVSSGTASIGDSDASSLTLNDLPPIPLTKRFDPKKLSSRDFRRCERPWALSSISSWLREMTEGEQDLKEGAVADGVAALFTHYVPTMNVADAETLASKIVQGMLKEQNLVKEEEWVKFGDGQVSGVIYQITGSGCYAPKLHEIECSGRCYAHHCARTLKKINLQQHPDEPKQKSEDWATFWKLKKEDTESVSKKEIERQNNLHEIVQTEAEYMLHLQVLKTLYRDQIANTQPPIIKPTRLDSFVRDVFGRADAVRKVSEEHLLPQLKFRQMEQGPWITGFSDIFREWIRKAKTAYLDYAAAFPKADMLVRREAERNILFKQFLDNCRNDPRSRRLDWVTFLKGPITRLQRYSLLLTTVLKHTITETEEKHNLERAIEEIKAVTLECDSRVDEMSKRVALLELGAKLIMRQWAVDLRLEEKGREVVFKGDLQRNGNNRFTWLETHAILFDHYLVLAKTTMQRDVNGGAKQERYDVSRMPIPMDLLVLESTDEDPVVRNAANRLGISGPAAAKEPARGGRHNSLVPTGPLTLQHTNTSTSISSSSTTTRMVTTIPDQSARDDKIMYPFRVKHLGNGSRTKAEDSYTLYAPSAANRQDWCEKIILAKERHAASLHAQNAEPFRLRVMADMAFGYETTAASGPKPIVVRGTPLDRAINEVEKMFENTPRPPVICRASVNCATAFTVQFGRQMVAIGTDYGVFTADANNPRGWQRSINIARVTQIAVLEEFSLFLVLADKALIAYHLDVVVPPPGADSNTKQRSPQKLSGARDVGFFATGRMKERSLVFYKKREGINSTFKVLEPVFQKATEKKSRFSRKGTTEFFREFDDFYIPTDCYGINLFHSSLSIQTAKGFEVMTLDKKQPWSVPELHAGHVADIASRLQGQRPLGMFRLSEIEFLLCYEECAVYVNKHGDVSRSVIMEFVGKAKTAAIFGPYVLVFDNDFVEIRNAQNGRLRQVIAGRDCRCLDDAQSGGSAGTRTIKVAMAHPEVEGRQLVVELLLNEGHQD